MQICLWHTWASEAGVLVLKLKAAAACFLWLALKPPKLILPLGCLTWWQIRPDFAPWAELEFWCGWWKSCLGECSVRLSGTVPYSGEKWKPESESSKWLDEGNDVRVIVLQLVGIAQSEPPSAPPVPAEQTDSGQSALLRVTCWMLPEGSWFCARRKVSPEHWQEVAWLRNRFFFLVCLKFPSVCCEWALTHTFPYPSRTRYQRSWQSTRKTSKNLMLLWKPYSEAVSQFHCSNSSSWRHPGDDINKYFYCPCSAFCSHWLVPSIKSAFFSLFNDRYCSSADSPQLFHHIVLDCFSCSQSVLRLQ